MSRWWGGNWRLQAAEKVEAFKRGGDWGIVRRFFQSNAVGVSRFWNGKVSLTGAEDKTILGFVSSEECQSAKEKFMEFIAAKGLRLTTQRRAIIDTVFNTEEHFTAEQLLDWSRRRDKSVSRSTVYRTLPLLTESGLVREVDFGKDYKFYDPNYANHPNHNHIVCQDCERIVEFESEKIERLEAEITHNLGFRLKSQRIQITANCEEFKKLGSCRNKDSS